MKLNTEKTLKKELDNKGSDSLQITPTKDDSEDLINKEIFIIVSQEPEITEKELRQRLELIFEGKKLPKVKALDNKINSIRTKLGTTSLDFVRKKI